MGMMDWVNDGDDETTDGDVEEGDTGDFDELDEFDDFGDEFDDDFGGEFDGGGDDFGDEFDDDFGGEFGGGDDDFGGDGGGGGADSERLADFEDRIGELETQVGSISSTMNTVREENKQIGETVDELDDTIRKLLDIYEMVTRGINPFVDDAREMGGLEHRDGAFGLFDSEEEDDDEALDAEIANADAESFFDEDFGEVDAEDGKRRAEEAATDELEGEGHGAIDESAGGDSAGSGSGGASFEDLKAEYDENGGWDEEADVAGDDETDVEADPADDVEADPEEPDEPDESDEPEPDESDESDEPEPDETVDDADQEAETDDELEVADEDPKAETDDPSVDVDGTTVDVSPGGTSDTDVSAESVATTGDGAVDGDAVAATASPEADPVGRERYGSERADGSHVHLATLPPTYVAESVTMEWVRYLVSVGGPLGATRALQLYQDFGWISGEVREKLDTYVRLVSCPGDDDLNAPLSVEHHETSLSYVSRLGDRTPDATALDALVADGGSQDGLRR